MKVFLGKAPVFFGLLLGIAVSASAQDYTGDMGVLYTDIGMSGAMMDAATESSSDPSMDYSRSQVDKNIMSIVANNTQPDISEDALVFRYSNSVQKKNLAQFVEKARAADPEGAAKLEQILSSNDIIGYIGQEISSFGLKTNNVADAYTVYWMTACKLHIMIPVISQNRRFGPCVLRLHQLYLALQNF